jgi:benzaldehyde dehydrogenase (NAD)
VAPVIPFDTLDEAVELANSCDFGLSIGILGEVSVAMDLADRLDSGKIHINEQTVSDESQAPFGGTKSSGNGTRIGGAAAALDAFTETQWVTLRSEIADYPF